MSNVLLIAEQAQGKLKRSTLSSLTAAREIAARTGGMVTALVAGHAARAAADDLASYGVDVKLAEAAVLEHDLAETPGASVRTNGPSGARISTSRAPPTAANSLKDGAAETGRDETLQILDVAEIVAARLT